MIPVQRIPRNRMFKLHFKLSNLSDDLIVRAEIPGMIRM